MRLLLSFAVAVALAWCSSPRAVAFGIRSTRADMLGGSLSLAHPSATDFLSAPWLVVGGCKKYLDAGVSRRFEPCDLYVRYFPF